MGIRCSFVYSNHSRNRHKLSKNTTMKTNFKELAVKVAIAVIMSTVIVLIADSEPVQAQEITPGVDFYSTYVFRGVAFSGPSIQPYVEFSSGGFALGAWGSQGIDGSAANGSLGFQEMDLYVSYEFDFGLSLGITDYYYPGSEYFDGDSHAFEVNSGLEISNFSLSANIVLNEAAEAGSAGSDLYFEAGYSFGEVDLFAGAGDGWHTTNGDFALVNVGLGTSKYIAITDKFSLPISGAIILNPNTEQFFIVAGISF